MASVLLHHGGSQAMVRLGSSPHGLGLEALHTGPRDFMASLFNLILIYRGDRYKSYSGFSREERGSVQAGDCPGYRRRPARDQGAAPPNHSMRRLWRGAQGRTRTHSSHSQFLPSQASGRHRDTTKPWVPGWVGPGGRPLVSTTHLARLLRTDPGPDPADSPGQRMLHDSHGTGLPT